MGKNDLVIQKNILDLLMWGAKEKHAPSSYWRPLFSSNEMESLLKGRPYQPATLQSIIDESKKSAKMPSYTILLYLSNLLVSFSSTTSFSAKAIGARVLPRYVSKHFSSLHLVSDDKALEILCLHYAETKSANGKADTKSKSDFSKANLTEKLKKAEKCLDKLFAPLWLRDGVFAFDERLGTSFLSYENGSKVFVLSRNLSSDEEAYYRSRYLSEGKTYSFVESLGAPSDWPSLSFTFGEKSLIYMGLDGENHFIPWHYML
jgi:hypothetical protein